MATFEITAPDGSVYQITAPDDATEEQVLAYAQQQFAESQPAPKGQLQAGNIDLNNRPVVRNPDGSISTVRSISANFDGKEYLLPTVSDDGRVLSDDDAIELFRKTGRNLGVFDTPENATAYAQSLHQAQEARYAQEAAPPPSDSYDPTEGMSAYEKFTAGIGKSLNDSWNGIRQLGGALGDAIPGVDLSEWRAGVDADVEESRQLDAALMNTGWGTAGNITGQAVQAAIPVGGAVGRVGTAFGRAAPYVAAATRGGAISGLQPVLGDESRATNALVGAGAGVVGQGVASGLGGLANRARNTLSPAIQRSIESAQAAGIPLRAAQVSDSKFLKTAQSVMDSVPLSGSGAMARRQQEAFNRAVGRSFGTDAPYLTDDVMAAARQRIGQSYNDVYGRNNIALDDEAIRRMLEIEGRAATNLTPENAQVVRNQVQRVLDAFENGQVPGALYQNLRGDLADVMDGSATGRLVRALRGEVDASASRSVGGADAEALRQANAQWANMRTAESALQQVSGASGNIRPASLYPLVRNGSTAEMRELAQIGQNVLKDPIPNSGTAQRELIYSMLGLGGGGFLASQDNPWAKAAGVGLLAGRALNSPALAQVLQASRPATQAAINGAARIAAPAPYALPAVVNAATAPALSLEIVGGTPGNAPTVEELEALRRRSLAR